MDALIINAAITGMVPMKSDNPNVPITVEEIIQDAGRCYDAGATIMHLHARAPDGKPAYQREIYQAMFQGVRERCPGVLISGSCSGRSFNQLEKRAQVLDCRPDLGSLTLGSMNFPQQASVNDPAMIQALATAMKERGIIPEWEIFDLGMAEYAHYLIKKGFLLRPYYANILLGSLGMLSATAFNLATVVRALPEGTVWAGAGIGRFQMEVCSLAVAMGGHVRIGLEDSLFYDAAKTQPATNAGSIERIVKVARALGREISTPEQTREILGIPKVVKVFA